MGMMAVNRYCGDCMKNGEFLPLRFVMMNISSGLWVCSKDECVFPMNSSMLSDYIEDNMTSEKVIRLTRKRSEKGKLRNSQLRRTPTEKKLSRDKLKPLEDTSPTWSYSSKSRSSEDGSSSIKSNCLDDASSGKSSFFSDLVSPLQKKPYLYPLWENEGLLCWLDAALAMLVLNRTLQEHDFSDNNCLIAQLLLVYKKLLLVFNAHSQYTTVAPHLNELRRSFLKFLRPKLLSNYGDEDSPLFSLPLIMKADKKLYEDLEIDYTCKFHCSECGFVKTDGFNKMIMSLPNCNDDLNFNNNVYFSRPCYRCFKNEQKTQFTIERYPKILFVHFKEGVSMRHCWDVFNFSSPDGEKYIVTQIVQYLNKKRHFVLWSYNYEEKLWLQADDLKEPVACYKYRQPKCRPEEVHIVIWERLSLLQSVAKPITLERTFPKLDLSSSTPSPNALLNVLLNDGSSSQNTSIASNSDSTPQHSPSANMKRGFKGMQVIPRFQPYISKSKAKKSSDKDFKPSSSSKKNDQNLTKEENIVGDIPSPCTTTNALKNSNCTVTNTSAIDTGGRNSVAEASVALKDVEDIDDTLTTLERVRNILSEEFQNNDIVLSGDEVVKTSNIDVMSKSATDVFEDIDFHMDESDVILNDILTNNKT